MLMIYHRSVLTNECIEGLNINPSGVYVDVTYGGGGHSNEILKQINTGRLFAFDRDLDAKMNIKDHKRFKLINSNYKHLKRCLKFEGINQVDGILADLGVSSHQLDTAERGFSYRFNAPLDMRMNAKSTLNASFVVNEYDKDQLSDLFFHFGDIKESRKIAERIILRRKIKSIKTTFDLIDIINEVVPSRMANKFFSKIFQSIRIEVNDELTSLKTMLKDGIEILNKGGRLVVISYHSIEDRIVKNLFKTGNLDGIVKKDIYGNEKKVVKQLNRKVIKASESELMDNPRSRSARMRIAEKTQL